jgi:heat-inducible transcriptional repressor
MTYPLSEPRRGLRLFGVGVNIDPSWLIFAVQVLIGGEGTWEDLRQCSVILARYGMPGQATGTLGVLGPMRMPYGRTISTVKFVANLLSDLVTETLAD